MPAFPCDFTSCQHSLGVETAVVYPALSPSLSGTDGSVSLRENHPSAFSVHSQTLPSVPGVGPLNQVTFL